MNFRFGVVFDVKCLLIESGVNYYFDNKILNSPFGDTEERQLRTPWIFATQIYSEMDYSTLHSIKIMVRLDILMINWVVISLKSSVSGGGDEQCLLASDNEWVISFNLQTKFSESIEHRIDKICDAINSDITVCEMHSPTIAPGGDAKTKTWSLDLQSNCNFN